MYSCDVNFQAAGTSMRHLLRDSATQWNASISVCDDLDIPKRIIDAGSFGPIASCDVVVGHVPYGIADGYNARNPVYAVMLREPVARTLSLLHYVRRNPDHYQYK